MIFEIAKPYLVLVGDETSPGNAKTGLGLKDWAPEACVGQLRFVETAVDLGLADMTLSEAVSSGAKSLVLAIAPPGGRLPQNYMSILLDALDAGMDIASGLHQRLAAIPALQEKAAAKGRKIHDIRHGDQVFGVGTGARRSGKRLLTVGTDCALGKKYTALALTRELRARGLNSDFRATGQTGILLSGAGIAIDAVVADFIAGAAEALSPAAAEDHWDVIEGQGAIFHPAYAGVTLGLLHGSQPDALVLCHDPTRTALFNLPHVPITSPAVAIETYLTLARLTNANARFVGVSLNTHRLDDAEAMRAMQSTSDALGLPCVDPIRTGMSAIADMLENYGES